MRLERSGGRGEEWSGERGGSAHGEKLRGVAKEAEEEVK